MGESGIKLKSQSKSLARKQHVQVSYKPAEYRKLRKRNVAKSCDSFWPR